MINTPCSKKNHTSNRKTMKCEKYECNNEAKVPLPCCSEVHGLDVRMAKKQIAQAFNANDSRQYGTRDLYSINEVEYYANL